MTAKTGKLKRHERLTALIEQNPLHTDEDLARLLKVSLSTIRLSAACGR